ncbi:hypothetical protein C8R45DRAFT_194753, partial [Mycena sanguinolenta]
MRARVVVVIIHMRGCVFFLFSLRSAWVGVMSRTPLPCVVLHQPSHISALLLALLPLTFIPTHVLPSSFVPPSPSSSPSSLPSFLPFLPALRLTPPTGRTKLTIRFAVPSSPASTSWWLNERCGLGLRHAADEPELAAADVRVSFPFLCASFPFLFCPPWRFPLLGAFCFHFMSFISS